MTAKYDSILLSKLIAPASFNLLEKYPKTHPILKLLTYEHFSPLFLKPINKSPDYSDIILQELNKKVFIPRMPDSTFSDKVTSFAQALKTYYCSKYFSLNYFIYYLTDIAETATILSQIPDTQAKTSDEVLNDIERKVLLVKSLDYYKSKSFIDRLQMTLIAQAQETKSSQMYSKLYETKVIDKEAYDKLDYSALMKVLGSMGNQKRRLGYEYGNYNYLPIICKRYCVTKSEEMIKAIEDFCIKCNCSLCKEVISKASEVNDEIRVLFLKTCCFCHNSIEYDYHPYVFHSFRCRCKDTSCPQKHDDTVEFLFNPMSIKDIRAKMNSFIDEVNLDVNSCHKRTLKTSQCQLLQGGQYHDVSSCKDSHNPLEQRRSQRICHNLPCQYAIKDNKWVDYSDCPEKEECPYYHTRNELLFDKRNYRKVYDCYRVDYCDFGELCPHKHPYDIDINEIYLPTQDKQSLKKELEEIRDGEKAINYIKEQLKKYECCLCLRYDNDVIYMNAKCKHFLCHHCKESMQICPVCPLEIINTTQHRQDEDDQSLIYIQFDLKRNSEQALNVDYSFNEGEARSEEQINYDNDLLSSDNTSMI